LIYTAISPSIDDGPSDLQTSIDMAIIADEEGNNTIVSTPHIKNVLHSTVKLRELGSQLNLHLRKQNPD